MVKEAWEVHASAVVDGPASTVRLLHDEPTLPTHWTFSCIRGQRVIRVMTSTLTIRPSAKDSAHQTLKCGLALTPASARPVELQSH